MASETNTSERAIRIGWASRDITPERPNLLRGQFYARVSEGVRDPITVTALALESPDGEAQAILVSCDLVGVPAWVPGEVRAALADRAEDFDPAMLIMHATHTHTAPTLDEGVYPAQDASVETPTEYAATFVERVAEAAAEAWASRAPGGVSWAYGHAAVGQNRRLAYRDGSSKMYGKSDHPEFDGFEGADDHGLKLLYTFDAVGELTGVVVNVACPSQVSEHLKEVSADYWHETRAALRGRLGEKLFVLPQCAPAGDQSPHLLMRKGIEELMRERRGLSEREEIARRITATTADCLDVARDDIRSDVPLGHVVETVRLPARMITEAEAAHARAEYERLTAGEGDMDPSVRFMHRNRHRRVFQRYDRQQGGGASGKEAVDAAITAADEPADADPSVHPIELHVLRVGDVAMATNPFELFLDFGFRMDARSPALQTMLIQLACGQEGYLPTRRAVAGGSYGAEAPSNRVGPEGGQVLVDRTVELFDQLWD